jgi:large subunit ribosomal protein L12
MEYVYGAMLLHSAKQEISEANLKKVVEAAGVKADDAKLKALVASLEGVDIEKAIEEAAVPVAAAPVAAAAPAEGEKKEEKKEEEKKEETEAASAGLGALFG